MCYPLVLCELGRGDYQPPELFDAPPPPADARRPVAAKPPPTNVQQAVQSPDDRYEAFVVAHSDSRSTWHTLHLTDRTTGRVKQITSDACYQFSELAWQDGATLGVRCTRLHDDCKPLEEVALGVRIVVKDE